MTEKTTDFILPKLRTSEEHQAEVALAAGKIVPTVNYRQRYDEKLGITVQSQFFIYDQLIRSAWNASAIARLPRDLPAHALWHYFVICRNSYERAEKNLVLEGQPDVPFNPRQLFTSIAGMYGVQTREMGKFWDVVRQQRIALGLSANVELPESLRYKS